MMNAKSFTPLTALSSFDFPNELDHKYGIVRGNTWLEISYLGPTFAIGVWYINPLENPDPLGPPSLVGTPLQFDSQDMFELVRRNPTLRDYEIGLNGLAKSGLYIIFDGKIPIAFIAPFDIMDFISTIHPDGKKLIEIRKLASDQSMLLMSPGQGKDEATPQPMAYQIFACYEDTTGLDLADQLKRSLGKRSVRVFVAKRDIPETITNLQTWRKVIDDVIKTCSAFVLIISANRLTSEMTRELGLGLERSHDEREFGIVICHLNGVPRSSEQLAELGVNLQDYQQIDFESKEELARKINRVIDEKGHARKTAATSEEASEVVDTIPDKKNVELGAIETNVDRRMLRLCNMVFNPVLVLPLIFVFSMGCFSLYFYQFNGLSVASLWFVYSQEILVLLTAAFSLSILYVYRHGGFVIKGQFTQRPIRSTFSYAWRWFSRNRIFLEGILLVVLVAGFVAMTDARLGTLTPRVSYVVTQYPTGYSVVGSVSNYHVIFRVNRKYFIDSPVLWVTKTIVIPNPSNYSYSSSPCYTPYSGYYFGQTTFCGVITATTSDQRAQLSPQNNSTNSIKAFQLVLTPTSLPYTTVLSVTYDDTVTSTPIAAVFSTPIGTGIVYYQLINITLSDPLSESILMNQLQIARYGDILNMSCARNGIAVPSLDCASNSTSTVWLFLQELNPGQTVNLILNVTYTGGVYT